MLMEIASWATGRDATIVLGHAPGHCGVALFIVGVTMVKGFEVEQDVRMNVGQTATIAATRSSLTEPSNIKDRTILRHAGHFM